MTKSNNGFSEIRKENRIVSGWLLHYPEHKQKYEALLDEYIHKNIHQGILVPPGTTEPSDPTGNSAVEIVEKLSHMRAWLELVEEVEQKLPWKMQVFLHLRWEARSKRGRIKGKPAWIPYVQRRYAEEIAKREGKKREDVRVNTGETFVRWWNRIVDYAARLAAKRGLLEKIYYES